MASLTACVQVQHESSEQMSRRQRESKDNLAVDQVYIAVRRNHLMPEGSKNRKFKYPCKTESPLAKIIQVTWCKPIKSIYHGSRPLFEGLEHKPKLPSRAPPTDGQDLYLARDGLVFRGELGGSMQVAQGLFSASKREMRAAAPE
jgi:hypothetical protein